MVFVIDLDDTVCDTDGYSEKYICSFIKEHNLPYKLIATNVRFADAKFDWTNDEAVRWYKEYGDPMMAEFPCNENAVKFLQDIHKAGHKIVIATARADDWHAEPREVTIKWLSDNKIPFDQIYVGRKDKVSICEEVGADFFVDDDVELVNKVACHFKSCGGKKQAFLFTTRFNEKFQAEDGVLRVKDFYDLEDKVKAILN